MPRMAITEENRSNEGADDFPRMKLATGEKARFILFQEPWMEWTHQLQAPVLEDGVGVKETRYRKDKTPYQVLKMEFIRRSICLGDPAVLAEKGLDENNCPACKASLESGGEVAKPVQRFAANVIRYTLQANTWKVRTSPFSVTIELWSFTARMWDELITLQGKIGNLREHDLTLDCEDGDWQRNKLSFEMSPAWKEAGPDGPAAIKSLLSDKANMATDDQLRSACGSVATRAYMQEDVNLILLRYRQVTNAGTASPAAAVTQSAPVDLDSGIDGLLGGVQQPAVPGYPTQAEQNAVTSSDPFAVFMTADQQAASQNAPGTVQTSQAQPSAPAVPAGDPFASLGTGVTGAVASTPAPQPSAPSAAAPSDDLSFESLLGI